MSRSSSPTVHVFRVRTVSGTITESPLVLTDVITDTGINGHSIVFTYMPAALKPTAELILNLNPW